MAEEGFKRKLAAILSADVEGYSRLMSEDEASTVKTITTYREILAALTKQHRGRVVDSPGDNVLAEFSSVVDAAQCAVAVQKEFEARNAELPENRRMEFRIGINLGDVIEEEDRIYGDGVNIAARLEALADPGGICISKTAFDHIESKLPLGYEYLGEQTVKNISKPVGTYRVLMEPRVTVVETREEKRIVPLRRPRLILAAVVALLMVAGAATVWHFYLRPATPVGELAYQQTQALELPDKPSIAVLPFVNISGDPEQEYFSDGITDNIITALSKIPRIFVIARNSVFTYKGKPVKVQQVSKDLGVRYVLEGSVQRAGGRVRVNAQLIDAITGHHLWAERYDRDIKDLFALQDEITKKIVVELKAELTEDEFAHIYARGTDNLEAFLTVMKGANHILCFTKDDNALGRQLALKAIALDPDYTSAYRMLGFTHLYDLAFGWSESPSKSMERALEMAQKVLAMDDSDDEGHVLLSSIYMMKRRYEEAKAEAERAIVLNPNAAFNILILANSLNALGKPEEAIPQYKKAMRLNPVTLPYHHRALGSCYVLAGRYEKAIAALKEALRGKPDDFLTHLWLTAAYSLLGLEEELRSEVTQVYRVNPKFSLGDIQSKIFIPINEADTEHLINALRKAGLK